MAQQRRKSAYSRSSGGNKSKGNGKIPNAAVKVVEYNTDSANPLEHYFIAEPISDIYDNSGKIVAEKGKQIPVFMPPEMTYVDGKKVVKQVRSRRDVLGLQEETNMAYGTGDQMPEGSIIGLSKLWVEESEFNGETVPVIKANYGAGLLHPDAQFMDTKYRPPAEGEEAMDDGRVLVGQVYGTDWAANFLPVKTVEKGADKFQTQRVNFIQKSAPSYVEGVEGVVEAINNVLDADDGDFGARGVLLIGYKKPEEGMSEEQLAEFGKNPDNRVAVSLLAFPTLDKEENSWIEPNGEDAVRRGLLENEGEYHQGVVEALKSGEWTFVALPQVHHQMMPSLIPGHDNNKMNIDFAAMSQVIEADLQVDNSGAPILNEKGYPEFSNPEIVELGLVDLEYAVANRNLEYFRKNGAPLDSKTSWIKRKETVVNGGFCSPGNYTGVSAVNVDGGNFYPKPAYYLTDVKHALVPEYVMPALEEERKLAVGKVVAFKKQVRDNKQEQEEPENDKAPEGPSGP